jgi:hypothetical protein
MVCTSFLILNLGHTEDEIASEGEGQSEMTLLREPFVDAAGGS